MSNPTDLTDIKGRPLKGRSVGSCAKFMNRLDELGATLVERHWLGALSPHRVTCVDGHECTPTPSNVNAGHGVCRVCAGVDPETSRNAFCKRVQSLGGTVTGDYAGAFVRVSVICAQGHPCNPVPTKVIAGGGICRVCAGQDPGTAEAAFRAAVSEARGSVVGEYINAKMPLHVVCAAGHDNHPTPSSVNAGRGFCRRCASAGPEQRFRNAVRNLGARVVGEYVNVNTKVDLVCAQGHPCSTRPADTLAGVGVCRTCTGKIWDVLYVVSGPDGVKIGVTSGDPKQRLDTHARNGYPRVIRLYKGLAPGEAHRVEQKIIKSLPSLGYDPIKGREYFAPEATDTVLDAVAVAFGAAAEVLASGQADRS